MNLIKNDDFYLAFNKKRARELISKHKEKKICVIDFESFQFYPQDKIKFPKITINDVPYTVGLGILEFSNEENEFVLSNEKVYQFTNTWNNQKELMSELEKMSMVIADYFYYYQIEELLYMARFQEVQSLTFFAHNFKNDLVNLESMSNKFIDVYDYFYNARYYQIMSYKYKVSEIIKTFMNKHGNIYENYNIGKDGMKFFRDHLRGKKNIELDFELIKHHNLIDLYKGRDLLNYINLLANWEDEHCINGSELKKENN